MKPVFIIEIKSSGSYFMTSIKGRYFRRIMDERGVRYQVVKEFEHQARQNLCTLNFSAAFNQVISECNLIMESCRDSLKATSKRVKTQIQKGANPESAAKNGYERTCDYLDILYRISSREPWPAKARPYPTCSRGTFTL